MLSPSTLTPQKHEATPRSRHPHQQAPQFHPAPPTTKYRHHPRCAALDRRRHPPDRALLDHVVATNPKQRFSYDASGTKIRANQGHSVAIDLAYTPCVPPETLYHGTARSTFAAIRESGGLDKRTRHHVHLSSDVETAMKVGQRHGKPLVLRIAAGEMQRDGHVFYQSDNGVWLTERVPLAYISTDA